MAEWPEARQIAANYQSPGATGIGFAVFASTGDVTQDLWDNIRTCERMAGEYGTEGWADDMARLRDLLAEDGISETEDEDEDEDEDENWKAADRAAVALQAYYAEISGDGSSYGDEGDESPFSEALQDLLTDLRHLAFRADVDFLELNEAASRRYMEEIDTEISGPELIEELRKQNVGDVTCEDTGGGTAVISIDGGKVQIGPGSFGAPVIFDTAELTFSFYEITEDDAEEIEGSFRQIQRGASVVEIAAMVGAAYRAHKIAKGEK